MLNHTAQEELRRHESEPCWFIEVCISRIILYLNFDTTTVPAKGRLRRCQDLIIGENSPLLS